MKKAGDYWQVATWYAFTRTADGTTGDSPKSYSSQGNLFCYSTLTAANEQNEFGAVRHVLSGQVRVRQYPDIDARDRLTLEWYPGCFFAIDGIWYDDNETVLEVHSVTGGVNGGA